jgi:hypothetical protein
LANYVKQTWTDGSGGATPISAARLAVVEQGVYDAHFQPAARVYHNANQSIATGTETTLAFNSERFDNDTIHDTSSNNSRLTCKTAGKYLISAQVQWEAGGTSRRILYLRLNGTTKIATKRFAAFEESENDITTLYDLAVNDYVEVRVRQETGGALNVTVTDAYSPEFMMVRVA